MYKFPNATIKGFWAIGMLICLAVGVQAIADNQTATQAAPPGNEPSIDETPRLIEENRQLKRQLVDAAAQAQEAKVQAGQGQAEDGPATLVTYGPGGRFISASQIAPRPYETYEQPSPRPKWRYREPICSPSRAQIAWAKMLPNYDGLASRGLSDEDIVRYFAPSEIKALEGDEVPEHLRPDTRPPWCSSTSGVSMEHAQPGTARRAVGISGAGRGGARCRGGDGDRP